MVQTVVPEATEASSRISDEYKNLRRRTFVALGARKPNGCWTTAQESPEPPLQDPRRQQLRATIMILILIERHYRRSQDPALGQLTPVRFHTIIKIPLLAT